MSKYSAVYYPHTTLRSPDLLRTALLLWDYVDCIVPDPNFSLTADLPPDLAPAAELILKPRYPTPADKTKVHKAVMEVFANGIPNWVSATLPDEARYHKSRESTYLDSASEPDDWEYLMYPRKLFDKTWRKLSNLDVAHWLEEFGDYQVSPALGLTLMASLASACAGEQQHRITDRVRAYSALVGMQSEALSGEFLEDAAAAREAEGVERLVTISTHVLDGSKVPLERLIELRIREAKESTKDLRNLRRAYLNKVGEHLKQITSAKSAEDGRRLADQFRVEMEDDLVGLKRELGMARTDLLLSKEVGVLVVAAAGSVVMPLAMAPIAAALKPVGVGALLKIGVNFRRARAKAFHAHPMSWLYLANRPRVEW